MNNKLKLYMKKNFNYDLQEYAVNKPPYTVGLPLILSIGAFIILTIIMGFDVFSTYETFMNFPIFMFALFVLVLVPLALKNTNRFYAIIITPRFMIQRCAKKEYTVINYNNITSFSMDKEGIVIKADRDKILLSVNLFKEEIDPIIDILEAKGKTFDPSKEYLIRPIDIIIKNNKVEVVEKADEDKIVSSLYDEYVSKYISLTPGFLDQLTFRNSVLESTNIIDKNVIVKIGAITVREDHPENTSFGQMVARDCIVLIENIVVKEVVIEGYEGLGKKDLVEMIIASNDASTIAQVEHGNGTISLNLTVGIQACNVVFGYDYVFVGWNILDKK